jgi:hypothetical protein
MSYRSAEDMLDVGMLVADVLVLADDCTLGWIERDFFLELRVAWGLKNKVLVPVNSFRNIFVFGLG